MVRLLVFDFNDDCFDFPPKTALSIEDYLKTKPVWKPELRSTILMFGFLSDSINDMMNNFGYLDSIVAQFEELQKRLSENKFAVLRTDSDNPGSFFIFEPKGDEVYFSFLDNLPMPYESFYPQVPSPLFYQGNFNQQAELYDYIEQNRSALIPELQSFYINQMLDVPVVKNEFLAALSTQTVLAKTLMNELATSAIIK